MYVCIYVCVYTHLITFPVFRKQVPAIQEGAWNELHLKDQKSAPGFQAGKDRFTVMFSASPQPRTGHPVCSLVSPLSQALSAHPPFTTPVRHVPQPFHRPAPRCSGRRAIFIVVFMYSIGLEHMSNCLILYFCIFLFLFIFISFSCANQQ